MKILNLYAGVGGNRKLWGDEHDIIAIENDPVIADIYKKHFPNDTVIVCDAHQYLLDHYKEFDFIWSSIPCQSHSIMRKNVCVNRGQVPGIYPDMKLYEEIIFLRHHATCSWVVENVKGYYDPLIKPYESGGHYFWSNFTISKIRSVSRNIEFGRTEDMKKITGFNLDKYKLGKRKDQVYHNCLIPELGLHIFNCAFKDIQKRLV